MLLEIRKFCEENYDNGYDSVVEAWDDEDLGGFIMSHCITSIEGFVVAYSPIIAYAEEVRSTALYLSVTERTF